MGQQNEIEDPDKFLKEINSHEEKLKDEDIFSEDSFLIAKNVAKEYINYKNILDKHQKKKALKNDKINIENYDKNKLDEISHKFDRLNKWMKMAKTPYKNNLQLFLNKITGEDKKLKNKNLYKDKSTDNIYGGKGVRRKNYKFQDFPETDRKVKNNNEPITIKKVKKKKTSSLDKYERKAPGTEKKVNNKFIIESYSDKIIEEKIISFYIHNKSKFKERLFKGPPECFRWISWCIINEVPLERDINVYNNYLVKDLEKEHKDRIIRDIQRTFSNKNTDESKLREKETSLYNVLKAFWNLDDQIGYCQGMNLLVGFMLLISEGNELDTFYLLVSTFSTTFTKRKAYEYSLRGLFSEEFPLLGLLKFIFEILLEENIPEVKDHLEELGITLDFWMVQWLQTLFTIVLPLNWCVRVWDCIFSDNIFFLVKFAIVFTKLIKSEILEKTEEIDIINFFKELQKFSMYPENKFLDNKSDINTLITKANKIKIDPEEFVKLYQKRNENYISFKIEMDKNNGIHYPLEAGNSALNDFKMNNRETVLFGKQENEKGKDVNIKQIDGLEEDEKEDKNIIEDEKIRKKHDNINYDPKTKKISIKINKHQINKEDENEIKIKPILQRKNNFAINLEKKLIIPKLELINNNKEVDNIENYFDNKKEEDLNENKKQKNNLMPPYKKKVMDKLSFNKDKNVNENQINIENNNNVIHDNNINNDININNNRMNMNNNIYNFNNNIINTNNINNENNYNSFYNQNNNYNNNIYNNYKTKYYNVNLTDDNKNLDRYYSKK